MPQPDRAPAGGRRVADGVDQVLFNRAHRDSLKPTLVRVLQGPRREIDQFLESEPAGNAILKV